MSESNLEKENESGGLVNKLITGIYQVDLCIAKRFLSKKSSCIISSDGDFVVMIRESLILLKDFHFDFKKNEISKITLAFGNDAYADTSENLLQEQGINRSSKVKCQYDFLVSSTI